MVGSLVELSATMVGPRRKIKEKYLLKRLNAVLKKKRNLDQNINDSKSQIWNSFFKNIISGIQLFCVRPHDPVDIIRVFLISYLLAESLKASQKSFKLHKFSSKHVSAWCQKKKIVLHHFLTPKNTFLSTLKANVHIFLDISVRKFLFQRSNNILSDGEWIGERLNNFFKAAQFLGFVKCF